MQLRSAVLALGASAVSVQAWSPSGDYSPANISCDNNINLLREASGVSDSEKSWLQKRKPLADAAMQSFLKRSMKNFTGVDDMLGRLYSVNGSDTTASSPTVGIAVSGGGYRAMFVGAGMIAAMDNRTIGADEHGLGGVLQGSTYLAGLSGGNWLTGTLALNNWTSVQEIVDRMNESDSIWNITNSIINPGGSNTLETYRRWEAIGAQVQKKQKAGFNVTITDLWSLALSYGFLPSLPVGGAGLLWSDIRDFPVFANGEMPMPISIADGRYPGTTIISQNATVFEFNPFEIGSWDPSLSTFSDLKYLGTKVSNGKPVNEGKCIAGYDQGSFIMGTSSSLFNTFETGNATKVYDFLDAFSNKLVRGLSEEDNDIAMYAPNPFKDSEYVNRNYSQALADSDNLFLVDGGEDGQGIPFAPVLQKSRGVDVVFAVDASVETDDSWPAGGSLVSTYERQFSPQGKGSPFPYVPGQSTFVNLGLNKRPTFFGCDARNLTDLEFIPPLVIYMPNTNYTYDTNTPTLQLAFNESERRNFIKNSFEAATRGNLTEDSNFAGCVGCAIIRRKQQALNLTLPKECEQCFAQYCWNGTIADAYTPSLNGNSSDSDNEAVFASATAGLPIAGLLGGSGDKTSNTSSSAGTVSSLRSTTRASSMSSITSSSATARLVSSNSSSTVTSKKRNAADTLKSSNNLLVLLSAFFAILGLF